MWAWLGVALVIALAVLTVSRLLRSWKSARSELGPVDPPGPGPA